MWNRPSRTAIKRTRIRQIEADENKNGDCDSALAELAWDKQGEVQQEKAHRQQQKLRWHAASAGSPSRQADIERGADERLPSAVIGLAHLRDWD
jgi:hypothetical protein